MDNNDEIDARLSKAAEHWQKRLPLTPDGSTGFERRVRSQPGSQRFGRVLATTAAAVVLTGLVAIAIVAVPTLGPAAGPAAAPSQTRSAVAQVPSPTLLSPLPSSTISGSPAVSATASQTGMPSPTGTAPPTAASSPFAIPTSPVVGFFSLGPGQSASWSPDSQHIAVLTGSDTLVFGADGSPVITYKGADDAVWLDANHLLLRDLSGARITGAPEPNQPNPVYEVAIPGNEMSLIGYSDGDTLSIGRGVVTFASEVKLGSFVAWDGSSWSATMSGYPAAWSAAGDELAVLHLTDSTIGLAGTLQILDWPSGSSVAKDDADVTGPTLVHFDPTGRYLGFMSLGQIRVLDSRDGSTRGVGPTNASDWFGWDAASAVVIGDGTDSVAAFDLSGKQVQTWSGLGESALATPDGSTLVLFTSDYANKRPPMTLVTGKMQRTIDVDGTSDGLPTLAPDGHALILGAPASSQQVVIVVSE